MLRIIFVVLFISGIVFAKPAPNFRGELMNGKRVSLKDFIKPNRTTLLCFWASWCAPCLQELTNLVKGMKSESDLAIDVVTVNVDTNETAADVKPTVKAYKLPFPVILDPGHAIFAKYHRQKSLPFSVLINSKSEIVGTFSGYHEDMFTQLKTLVTTHASTPTR